MRMPRDALHVVMLPRSLIDFHTLQYSRIILEREAMDLDRDARLPSVIGGEISRIISVAFFSLFVYEVLFTALAANDECPNVFAQWLITLADEVEYFWSGKWTLTRCLFLLNRYFVLFVGVIDIISVTVEAPSQSL
ncbi:hypothetical protein BDZ89DRAFT_359353 [Hymenopellis radicata]|nr:hypothetical protein BDZ89DRAFT_359353 [Hymenopellis radicata]